MEVFCARPPQRRREAWLRRLRQLAATATRAELERLAADVGSEPSESSLQGDGDGRSADPPLSTPPRMAPATAAPGPSQAPGLAPRALDEAMLATTPPPQGDPERARVRRGVEFADN